jgi:HTH-type transcriptional regulator/antitoxin HigA
MNKKFKPFRVSSPGNILARELAARNWAQKDLAQIMGRPEQVVSGIIKATKSITPETAMDLESALGIDASFWLRLDSRYKLFLAEKRKDNNGSNDISRKAQIYDLVPVNELTKRGYLIHDKNTPIETLEAQVCELYEVSRIEDIGENLPLVARHSPVWEPDQRGLQAWITLARHEARKQSIAISSKQQIRKRLDKILEITSDVSQICNLRSILQDIGVGFVVIPHFQKTYLDGAVFYENDRPVIGLTLRYDRIDNFWFTLFHELGHIIHDHKRDFFDSIDNKADSDKRESEADEFAQNLLIPNEDIQAFRNRCNGRFTRGRIIEFAAAIKRHPGIVVGRLQHDKDIPYSSMKSLIPKVSSYL